MKRHLIIGLQLVLILLLSRSRLEAQSQHAFTIHALGTQIGTMGISRTDSADYIVYKTESEMHFNLVLKQIHISIVNRTLYHKGMLIRATNHAMVNGKLNSSSLIEWQGNQYQLLVDGETKPPVAEPVHHSGSLLYFDEPTGIKETFTESSGLFMPFKKLEAQTYQAEDPHNGRDITYQYAEGRISEVRIKHRVLTIKMKERL